MIRLSTCHGTNKARLKVSNHLYSSHSLSRQTHFTDPSTAVLVGNHVNKFSNTDPQLCRGWDFLSKAARAAFSEVRWLCAPSFMRAAGWGAGQSPPDSPFVPDSSGLSAQLPQIRWNQQWDGCVQTVKQH